ncbi:MAG: acyl-CoA reductase [Saprospiraceae bacterium]
MKREEFLRSLEPLKNVLSENNDDVKNIIQEAYTMNSWFIPEFTLHALSAISSEFLDAEKCENWLNQYHIGNHISKRIGIVMAGNIPLVGFHDLFCVLASGHQAVVKLSDKDSVLMKFLMEEWRKVYPDLATRVHFTNKLEGFEAVIATGSNNSSRYFEYYFRNHPHILRRNRNGVAVLSGNESARELLKLADDIFLYFGLGCRSVSHIYVPENYSFELWDVAIEKWKYLADHNKYKNNLDYNFAIYIINQVPHLNLESLILKEDEAIPSRIGCVHYSYYSEEESLIRLLASKREEIQCIASAEKIKDWDHIRFGQSQYPALNQYADGVDTMTFLTSL